MILQELPYPDTSYPSMKKKLMKKKTEARSLNGWGVGFRSVLLSLTIPSRKLPLYTILYSRASFVTKKKILKV